MSSQRTTTDCTLNDQPFELKIHFTALFELAVLLGIVVALELFFQPGLIVELKPHPFWIPVLLVSLQYGTIDGLVAVAASTVAVWLLGWPQPHPNEDYLGYLSRVWNEPLLWLGAAILIGEFRLRQLSELRGLQARVVGLEKERELLKGEVVDSRSRVRFLETHLAAGIPENCAALIEACSEGGKIGSQDLERALVTIGEVALGAETLSLFQYVNGALVLVVRVGSAPELNLRPRFRPGEPIYERVVRNRTVLCAARGLDHAVLEDQGTWAAPICSAANGEVIGMLKIERMLTPQQPGGIERMERTLLAVCKLLAARLHNLADTTSFSDLQA